MLWQELTPAPVAYTLFNMPITKSAIKRMRQNVKRRRRNLHIKTAMKDEIKSLRAAIAEGNKKLVAERLSAAQSKLDKAAKTGIIHANKAARAKSQLVKLAKGGPTAVKKAVAAEKPAAKAAAKKPLAEKSPATKPESDK